ncbi:hypothetical protein A3742_05875 [Oleiphilus sp. HI0071]|nr:hypothetical protein A3737_24270 [Oleiphilus sp. HI0065]KZY84331.1 hypothetical protein A3742_05875 [Oleiphilus sp. HI0071]KZZ02431.1 hypothetical protein A3744_11385 [Oleiphilus sp. HI0073]KZZ13219.1 hypothetical protein A3750_04090 [Oleiphilus sp. HI0079]KZZ18616.1 hypothetical protein A3751_07495 [Oleiphilus sp. HI0080]KZZ44816.1 hypothetical protein A3758_02355 [Oleiphilus sp. HI0118]KZZ50309.1 hypothetical protein A3760_02120 [Oleiphilus sp. HI0122]KZZ73689.1 hypothetical protein A37
MDNSSTRTEAILATIAAIPKGRLSTYGHIAQAAGYSGNARLVGQILKQLPSDSSIPWFRVINAQGKISFPESSEHYLSQKNALMAEGHPALIGKSHLSKKLWP